jgi:hypothetical protein
MKSEVAPPSAVVVPEVMIRAARRKAQCELDGRTYVSCHDVVPVDLLCRASGTSLRPRPLGSGTLNGAIAGEIILVQAFEGLRIGSGPKPISKAPLRSLNARLLLTAIAGRLLLMLTLNK